VEDGQVHAIMGPNGAGKSTLARTLAGDPSYEAEGEALFSGQNLLKMRPEKRAHLGLFLSFQYPQEIAGVSNALFLETAFSALRRARGLSPLSGEAFRELLEEKMAQMQMKPEFNLRSVNVGFSGGEKKRNEILQMALFEPKLSILDETDSGLDVDAMRIIADGINHLRHPGRSIIVITHYARLLEYVRPDRVHIMLNGRMAASGGPELAARVEKEGYEWATA
jgi:Fe-S cluster assembly ATP-binding protein